MKVNEAVSTISSQLQELQQLRSALAVLSWDQHVMMPKAGAQVRAGSMSLLSGIYHDRLTRPALREAAATLGAVSQDPVHRVAAERLLKQLRQADCQPKDFVTRCSEVHSAAGHAWVEARQASDFGIFAPHLETIVELARQKASYLQEPGQSLYDALLDLFDPGETQASLDELFDSLGPQLRSLRETLLGQEQPGGLEGSYAIPAQKAMHQKLVSSLGFDLASRGRLDESAHPFTIGLHPDDVRITSRYREDEILGALSATIHETGHGLYEQGLPQDLRPLGLCEAASTGMHESQSRFWENQVGRSAAFFEWLTPLLQSDLQFPHSARDLFQAANAVRSTPIRVESDELSYNLHILIRYQLERRLLDGELSVADLPQAWDDAYEHWLGFRPASMAEGVLQDIHWSMGHYGYFPSYTLGNLYAAAFGSSMREELDLPQLIRAGDFAPILDWMRRCVHQHGSRLTAKEILAQSCDQLDPVDCFMAHLRGKLSEVYKLDL